MLAHGHFVWQDFDVKTKKAGAGRSGAKLRIQESAAAYPNLFGTTPTAPSLIELAKKFGLRQETLSRMTGFSLRAVAGWAGGKKPSAPVQRALTEMDRMLDALGKLMEPKNVGRWLKEPNPALDGSTPVQVIERGQSDRIWRLLYFVESGEPG